MTVLLDENPGITLACDQEGRNQASFLRFDMFDQPRLQPRPDLRSFRMVVRGQGGEQVPETGLQPPVVGQESIANWTDPVGTSVSPLGAWLGGMSRK